jgi:hypothetical protein
LIALATVLLAVSVIFICKDLSQVAGLLQQTRLGQADGASPRDRSESEAPTSAELAAAPENRLGASQAPLRVFFLPQEFSK